MSKEKVILAYSGGLDTSTILKWLQEEYEYEVIAVCCDAGQEDDYDAVNKKALAIGASKSAVIDIREEFVKDYIWPCVKAGAVYEDDYLLGTAMARPLIAAKLVEAAHNEGASIICHGCTGKGNDQVRFESAIHALDPELKIIAPWRIWDFRSREDLIEYDSSHGVPIEQTVAKIYSRDENIWHISHEGGALEDPWNEHPDDIHVLSLPAEKAPDRPTYVEIGFEAGIPISIDGESSDPVALIETLNALGGANGIGTCDIVENRLVGMKSRGVYETPGGTIIFNAHKALEKLCLDRDTMHFKQEAAIRFADLVYDGKWFTPLREALSAFVDVTQENVTGTVRMKLYKGTAAAAAAKSPYSLYSEEFATFGEDEVYKQSDAEGFINLFSLPQKVRAMLSASSE